MLMVIIGQGGYQVNLITTSGELVVDSLLSGGICIIVASTLVATSTSVTITGRLRSITLALLFNIVSPRTMAESFGTPCSLRTIVSLASPLNPCPLRVASPKLTDASRRAISKPSLTPAGFLSPQVAMQQLIDLTN